MKKLFKRHGGARETARYWVIKKETLDATRNAFYNAWNSFDVDPRNLDGGDKWLVPNPDSPGLMSLGLDEATELACFESRSQGLLRLRPHQ